MIERTIPSTGEPLPVIGLGTWQTFDVPPQSAGPLVEIVNMLTAAGGRMIDTSPMYGGAEEIVGVVRSKVVDASKLFLATKVWTRGKEDGRRQIAESRRLIGVKTFDLLQIHNLLDWQAHLLTLHAMKQRGEVRYIGVTHYHGGAFDDLESIMKSEKIDFVQLPYSAGYPKAAERLLPLAQERGIAVLVNRPLEEGALLRKVRGREMPPVAKDLGCTSWPQLFLKFIVAHPAVTCVIPATSNRDHFRNDLAAGEEPLPDQQQQKAIIAALRT